MSVIQYFFNFIFFPLYFFNWRIIALQNFVGFCQTSTRISHRYTYIPFSQASLLAPSPPPASKLSQSTVSVSWIIQKIPPGYLFTYSIASFHVAFSIYLTLSRLPSLHVHKFVVYFCFSIAILKINSLIGKIIQVCSKTWIRAVCYQ